MSAQLDVGSWGLFCGPEGRQLVLVDGEPCGPVSARKITRSVPRRLLLDEGRVAQVFKSGSASTELVSSAGTDWVVTLRPLISPRTQNTTGVFAAVSPVGFTLPDPPLVGGWEWEIERDENGRPTPRKRSYWDRNEFELYDVEPAALQRHLLHWETSEWSHELIDQADQMRVNSSIRDAIQAGAGDGWGGVRSLTCNVITGYGSAAPGIKHVRFVAQTFEISADDRVLFLQGFSYEVPDTFHDLMLEQEGGRVDDVLYGVMELTKEPMAVVDSLTLDVLTTSPAWRQEDFGSIGGFGAITSEGAAELRALIHEVSEDLSGPRSMWIDLRRSATSVERVHLTAIGVQPGPEGRNVVVRLDL